MAAILSFILRTPPLCLLPFFFLLPVNSGLAFRCWLCGLTTRSSWCRGWMRCNKRCCGHTTELTAEFYRLLFYFLWSSRLCLFLFFLSSLQKTAVCVGNVSKHAKSLFSYTSTSHKGPHSTCIYHQSYLLRNRFQSICPLPARTRSLREPFHTSSMHQMLNPIGQLKWCIHRWYTDTFVGLLFRYLLSLSVVVCGQGTSDSAEWKTLNGRQTARGCVWMGCCRGRSTVHTSVDTSSCVVRRWMCLTSCGWGRKRFVTDCKRL